MIRKVWTLAVEKQRPSKLAEAEKAAIVSACDGYIRDVLKPRFLPEIRPNEFNYPTEIFGDWRAGRYRFIARFRSDSPNRIRDEFDLPFARLDYMGPDCFDIYWMRHNDQWWPLHRGTTLKRALQLLIEDGNLYPF